MSGRERCDSLGHELQPVFSYLNGLLVGYCTRCEARVEIPWFRGGTMAVLGTTMAAEALRIVRPEASVVEDLTQIAGLLEEDLDQVREVLALVHRAQKIVDLRRSRP